jgi:voltage-gated potassium channel
MKKNFGYLIAVCVYLVLLLILLVSEQNHEGSTIKHFGDALWYFIVTVSTVGYGAYYPISPIGRVIGVVFVMSSIGLFGYFISQVTLRIQKYMDAKKMGLFGTKMKDHIVIIGYDKFSNHIIKQIVLSGKKVAVVTNKKEDVDLIATMFNEEEVFILYTDLEDYENLKKVNINDSSRVFINFPDDTEMLVYVLNIESHYKDLEMVVTLNNSTLKSTFKSAGVLYAVSRDEIAAKLVASYIFEPDVAYITEDLMEGATKEDEFDMMEFEILKNNQYNGMEYNDVFHELRKEFSCVLLGIYKDKKVYKNPTQKLIVTAGDYLIFMSDLASGEKIKKAFKVNQGRF